MVERRFDGNVTAGVALRGVTGVAFGLLALWQRDAGSPMLVHLFAAYTLFDGLFALVAAMKLSEAHGRWWPMLLCGLTGVAVGGALLVVPPPPLAVAADYIAVWAIVTGAFELVAARALGGRGNGGWLLVVAALGSIAFGIALALRHAVGMGVIARAVGCYALAFGGLLIWLSVRLRHAERPPLPA